MNQTTVIEKMSYDIFIPLWVNILITISSVLLFIYFIHLSLRIFVTPTNVTTTKEKIYIVIEQTIEFIINITLLIISYLSYKDKYDVNYAYWKDNKINVYILNLWNSRVILSLSLYIYVASFMTMFVIQNYNRFINTTTNSKINTYLNKLKQSLFNIVCFILYVEYVIILIILIIASIIYYAYYKYNDHNTTVAVWPTTTYISLALDLINIPIQIMSLAYITMMMLLRCRYGVTVCDANRKQNKTQITNPDNTILLTNI